MFLLIAMDSDAHIPDPLVVQLLESTAECFKGWVVRGCHVVVLRRVRSGKVSCKCEVRSEWQELVGVSSGTEGENFKQTSKPAGKN